MVTLMNGVQRRFEISSRLHPTTVEANIDLEIDL